MLPSEQPDAPELVLGPVCRRVRLGCRRRGVARRVAREARGPAPMRRGSQGRDGARVELLVLDRWDVAERGVQAGVVVPADPLDDRELGLLLGAPHAVGDQLGLERVNE